MDTAAVNLADEYEDLRRAKYGILHSMSILAKRHGISSHQAECLVRSTTPTNPRRGT